MDIRRTLSRYGYTVNSLAKKCGVGQSGLNQTVTGNPTAKKLQDLAEMVGCQRWEFFLDEIEAAGFVLVKREDGQQPTEPTEPQSPSASASQGRDGLPFGGSDNKGGGAEPTATMQQAIICPHCHQALVFNIATYERL